jgi:hypothetical protein
LNNSYSLSKTEIYDILFTLSESGDPPSGAARLIDVGTSQFLDYFKKEIFDEFISLGCSTCRFFEGAYGSGKTHILQLIEDCALENDFLVCHIDLKHELSFERWDQITQHILENCYFKCDGEIVKSFPDIISKLGYENQIDLEGYQNQNVEHPCLKNAIIHGLQSHKLNEEEWGIVRRFMMGEKVLIRELRSYGFNNIKKSLTVKNAEQFLNTVINSIYYLNKKGIVLLFDETDRSWLSHRSNIPKKVHIAANLIRRFIDASSDESIKGVLAVFAVLPNFIRDCIECYTALGQRIMLQDLDGEISWRCPVLNVNAVNATIIGVDDVVEQREIFLKDSIKKFREIVEYCNGDTKDFYKETLTEGLNILQNTAGDEYKRELIKFLTYSALKRIDENEI